MHAARPDDIRFSMRVAQIRAQFGATECARLLSVSPGTVHGWVRSGRASKRHRREIDDLIMIGELFTERGSPEVALPWLHAMNPALAYETPADEILRGRWVLAISAARDFVRAA